MNIEAAPALDALIERVREAGQTRTPLAIRAGGTKSFYGNPINGNTLDPRGHTGIMSYEPSELVLTARCGTPLTEIETTLATHNQMLGFEPPHFGSNATLGGTVAAGLCGPRRIATFGGGATRDFVLGATLLNAHAEVLTFGGQVMKNVAGYDIARLLVGSLGILGLILDVSLKVIPKPRAVCTLRLDAHESAAIQQINAQLGQPYPITATLWHEGASYIRLSGSHAGVQEARSALGGTEVTDPQLWTAVREHTHPFFSSATPLWRLSVPPTTPPLELGPTLIEWGGALRWVLTDAPATRIRARAQAAGGHATLFRGGDPNTVGAFQPLNPALEKIHVRLKHEFDPHRIFNRGRLYAHL